MSGRGTESIPLIILAGGKGSRLRGLEPNRPKPMVLVGGHPFLHWLVAHFVRLGFRHFILSTGHMAEIVESYEWSARFQGCHFEFARESEPLGTGGAVAAIFAARAGLERAWVINGDTLLPLPLPIPASSLEALYTALSATELFDALPNLHVEGGLVTAHAPNGRYFDGGAVFLSRAAIRRYAKGPDLKVAPCALHDLLGPAIAARKVGWQLVPGTCYDIGTPERYKRFEEYLSKTIRGES